jgi:2-alkyl-3-oxoalkanoate reductase
LRVPAWLARLAAGGRASMVSRLPGASNAKAKRELGWEPRWRSWREGFREAPR